MIINESNSMLFVVLKGAGSFLSCVCGLGAACFFSAASICFAGTSYPAWWTNRNVITNVAATNDYAAVNQGQLKWFATNAYNELNAQLPNGAGTNIANLIHSFSATNNYCGVNVGQLKCVASNFYSCLIAAGYANQYPWTGAAQTNDYALANIGQLKNVFNFSIATNIINTNTVEQFVYQEDGYNCTALTARASILGLSQLRVTLSEGTNYNSLNVNNSDYGTFWEVMNGSGTRLHPALGCIDTDSAQLIAWWGTNCTNTLYPHPGADNLLPQPGWNTTNRDSFTNVACWVSNGTAEIYWETNLPPPTVATQLDVLIVYTDIKFNAGIIPPAATNWSDAYLYDKPAIIGYWHANYDSKGQVWNWVSVTNLAPASVTTNTYQGEVVDQWPPIPKHGTNDYGYQCSTNEFATLTQQITHVQNVISNMTGGAYSLGYRKATASGKHDQDSGFDIRTNHVAIFPWGN
jgi:hypothetical protein